MARFGRRAPADSAASGAGFFRVACAVIAFAASSPGQAFNYEAATMRGTWSAVRITWDESGQQTSVAITPDPTDPNRWHEPAYPTTYLCRAPEEEADRANCRSYIVYVPNTYDPAVPAPVYMSLHGNGGFAEQQMGHVPKLFSGASPVSGDTGEAGGHSGLEGRLNELAEQHRFIAVYPNGTHDASATSVNGRLWNDCRTDEPAGSDVYDDIGFFRRLLGDLSSSLNVDARRVYAHGYSNGGVMIYRLYLQLGHYFTAFATTAGLLPQATRTECQEQLDWQSLPDRPKKPLMMVFGDADFVVPYYAIGVRFSMMTVDNHIKWWTTYLGTDAPVTPDDDVNWTATWWRVPDINRADGPAETGDSIGFTHLYDNGDEGTEGVGPTRVWVKKIQGGGHSLSGFEPIDDPDPATAATLKATLGPKNMDVQAADELYAFFSQFAMKGAGALAPMGGGCHLLGLGTAPLATADETRGTPSPLGWEGEFKEIQVCYPAHQSGAQQAGYFFAPPDIEDRLPFSLPVVVIGPGSGSGRAYQYLWSARELAANGYLVLVSDPQGVGSSQTLGDPTRCGATGCPGVPFQQANNFVDNFVSGIDFMFSLAHPWLLKADLANVGIAGHSLSARSASYVQGIDDRVAAVVAWDNMSSTLEGDEGVSSGGGTCGSVIGGEVPLASRPVTPRVPVLGEASDAAPGCGPARHDPASLDPTADPFYVGPDIKKTGYNHWREAGVPSMQVVLKGAGHTDFSQTSSSDPAEVQMFQYFTRAWFDLFLKDDASARDRLLARPVLGKTPDQILSGTYRSAVFLPGAQIECPDLLPGICVPRASLSVRLPSGALVDGDVVPATVLTFDARGSSVVYPNDPITSYTFDFGDGNPPVTQTEPTVTHTYARSGSFTPRLTAINGHGLSGSTIAAPVNVGGTSIAVALAASPVAGTVGDEVAFTASVLPASDGLTYTFHYGDGSNSGPVGSPASRHRYTTVGIYQAYVVVADENLNGGTSALLPITMTAGVDVDTKVPVNAPAGGAWAWLSMLPLALAALARRRTARAVVALLLVAVAGVARAAECDPTAINPNDAQNPALGEEAAVLGWEGEYVQADVCYPSRQSGAQLHAYLYAPKDIDTRSGPLPLVVIGPGSGNGRAKNYMWAGRTLAGQGGYLALVYDPQGNGESEVNGDPASCGAEGCPGVPFQSADNFVDGFLSTIDFAYTRDHAWLQKADLSRGVGIAGHSLSARAGAYVSGIDERVSVLVAWDNLSSTLEGDAGISSGGGACGSVIGGEPPGESKPVTIRVPAMGHASDAPGTCDPDNTDPDLKKTAYKKWREAGQPSMQLVFKDAVHGDWSQTSSADPELLRLFEYYTRAWFDLFLKQDNSARARLLARKTLDKTAEDIMSADFRSAAFLPAVPLDCDDLRQGCPGGRVHDSGSGLVIGTLGGWTLLPLALLAFARRWPRR